MEFLRLFFRMSFCWQTSGSVAKCWLFSQAINHGIQKTKGQAEYISLPSHAIHDICI